QPDSARFVPVELEARGCLSDEPEATPQRDLNSREARKAILGDRKVRAARPLEARMNSQSTSGRNTPACDSGQRGLLYVATEVASGYGNARRKDALSANLVFCKEAAGLVLRASRVTRKQERAKFRSLIR